LTLSAGQWGVLWTLFFTCATYINAGWMREQVCMYMCPYARFQSVMFDQDTLIVSYDPARGEPRGSRKRDADYKAQGLGDCIDCSLCVQVCPTGIDIRDGLQYECIGCALCIDACNSVMDKMSYPRGLISYTSEHQLQGGKTHWLRPRMIGYVLVLTVMVSLFSYRVISRVPLEMTVIRDRNELYVTTMDGDIENIYTLSLVNMEQSMHEFEILVSGIDGAEIIGDTLHTLDGGEVRSINLRVRVAPERLSRPSTEIEFTARATDRESLQVSSESRFMRPL
jgi:cytochrome c oxidase accessory protein FixG